MKFEVGVVKGGLIRRMASECLSIWRTWRFAKRNGFDPTAWYGVYEAGTEIRVANCGPLPGAFERARKIVTALEQ